MSRWFRYYDDVLNDPKVQLLPDRPINYFKCWVNLLSVASKNGGVLVSIEVVSYALRLHPEKAAEIVTFLARRGLLDPIEGGYFEPHNWKARQFQSDISTERVKQHRERKKKRDETVSVTVSSPVPETPPDTEQITDPEPKGSAAEQERALFTRGKEVLGKTSGGLIAQLLKAKGGETALARAAIETASTKQDPREYVRSISIGKSTRNGQPTINDVADDLIARAKELERKAGFGEPATSPV